MKNITRWAAASAVIAIFGACTTEVTTNSDGGTTTSGGAGGTSTTTAGGSGGSTGGSGGSGGSSSDGGSDLCVAKTGDTACRTCALAQCKTELCACEGDTGCAAQVGKYFDCLSKATTGMEEDACSSTFVTDSNPTGGGEAGDVASCMTTDTSCAAVCQGKDAGPRPRPRP